MTDSSPADVYAHPPRKNVMLLSCMDQRLLDDIVRFMNDLNLQNRYDQVIFAGAAMGAAKLATTPSPNATPVPWKDVFFDHLVAAIEGLERPIRDIFLLEHMDCGAYAKLHPDTTTRAQYEKCKDAAGWRPYHAVEVQAFAGEVVTFCKSRTKRKLWKEIHVWSLLMDLRGKVETLGCVST